MPSVRRWLVAGLCVAGVLTAAGPARAGFLSLTLSAGLSGSSTAADTRAFEFTAAGNGSTVAVTSLAVGDTVTAGTAGGVSIFGGAGVPVVLNVGDGAAYLASSAAPDAVKPAGLASV